MKTLVWGIGVGLLLVFGSFALDPFPRFLVGELAVLVIVSIGVNLVIGIAGMFSVASPAFLGIGATLSVALMIRGVPLVAGLASALVVGWTIGWLLGLLALRLSGIYLAIVTLGFLQAVLTLLNQGGALTGGGYGLIVPIVSVPFLGTLTTNDYISTAIFLAAVITALSYFAIHSRIGRAWIAAKSAPVAAEVQGIDLFRLKTLAFAASSSIIALAGGLQALLLGITNPNSYGPDVAIAHFSYIVVGGMGPGIVGPVIGPVVLFIVPQLFHELGRWLDLFYGGLMLLVLAVAPRGIAGAIYDLYRRLAPVAQTWRSALAGMGRKSVP